MNTLAITASETVDGHRVTSASQTITVMDPPAPTPSADGTTMPLMGQAGNTANNDAVPAANANEAVMDIDGSLTSTVAAAPPATPGTTPTANRSGFSRSEPTEHERQRLERRRLARSTAMSIRFSKIPRSRS